MSSPDQPDASAALRRERLALIRTAAAPPPLYRKSSPPAGATLPDRPIRHRALPDFNPLARPGRRW
ncbi:hypothetical protein [Rhodanobacter sp. FW106-PBR-R2A-1-13]|uniref:hypothetical protein n=1 Tax=Rhodanobacter sp. FW106-PBR-R2A-1-13 TaxID=3454845 RepID=UPI0034E48A27